MRWRMKETGRARAGRGGRDAAEDRRAETVRRFVTVTRALASSGGECCVRSARESNLPYVQAACVVASTDVLFRLLCVRAFGTFVSK